jgi:hypothetical protein
MQWKQLKIMLLKPYVKLVSHLMLEVFVQERRGGTPEARGGRAPEAGRGGGTPGGGGTCGRTGATSTGHAGPGDQA